MGIIRGKIQAPRELRPRSISVGNPNVHKLPCGCWQNIKTGKIVEVKVQTFDEAFSEVNEPECQALEGEAKKK